WKSADAGANWLDLSSRLPSAASAIAVDPRKSATIYAATGVGVTMSTDGGESWTPLASNIVAAQFLIPDPKSDTLYAGGPSWLFEIASSNVTAITFDVTTVRAGASFIATIAGSNLSDMYFDVRVLTNGAEDLTVLNWQMGTSASHSVPAGIYY